MPGSITVELDDAACSALHRLSVEHDMPQDRIMVQALRLYHQHNERLKAGETCTWSGDAERARQFAGKTPK